MTKTTAADIVDSLLSEFEKTLHGFRAEPKLPFEGETGTDVPEKDDDNEVDPLYEAVLILRSLTEGAGDFEDDLRLQIVDRYIEIGKIVNA